MSGRATSGGAVFQAEVGAYVAGLVMAERPLSRLGLGLPDIPKKLFFETPLAVDDILVETDRGSVYVQAKHSINLSTKADGELASVADQFVRQFRFGINEDGIRRNLDPFRDRLVLAVGQDTPATVANHLREALDRNRTNAATAVPNNLAAAFRVFSDLIEAAWLKEAASPISPAEKQAILKVCSVVIIGDSQRQLVEESLRDVVASYGDESNLVDILIIWAANASKSGTGGDVEAILLSLRGVARLMESPSFKGDVKRLTLYSAGATQRLKRFTEIATPEGNITIVRPVAGLIADAAQAGSLVITGEPGAGKSAILHAVAEELGKEGQVVTFMVEAGSNSMDSLQREIGLEHPLIEVLKQLTGDKPAYLVLDALDAIRGGSAEATYKRLVEEVLQLPGWHVIATVRTFDLRLGKEWQRLFSGKPPYPEYADKSFPPVRHVHIGLLTENEKADMALKSPTLVAAIDAGGQKIEALARNPFNLALLGDLLKAGVSANSLSSVTTRGELLERYWQERISGFGTPGVVSLKSIVSLMIASRAIDIPETEVPITIAETIDKLQQTGVLVTELNHRIGFRHHVLFDYAVARLLLLPDRTTTLNHLNKTSGAGLLISPSLSYWLEDLKKSLSSSEFWSYIVLLVGNEVIDPIIRVEVARLVVESVQPGENLNPLVELFKQDNPAYHQSFTHLAGSLITKIISKQPIETEPWAHLLGKLGVPRRELLGGLRALIGVFLNKENSAEAMKSLGLASRALFDVMSAHEELIGWLAPGVVPYVAQTYGTDPAASRQRLDKIFVTERFERYGFIEVPWLAGEVMNIAEHDADFVVNLFYRVFLGGNFSRDQATPMSGSWILSLTSNAAQDFKMAEHTLSSEFPNLIQKFPKVGVRALAATLRGEQEKNHPAKEKHQVSTLPLADMEKAFDEDGSHVWAWDIDNSQHDDHAKIYQTYMAWVSAVSDSTLIEEIPTLILQETDIALAWRALFETAAKKPETLGQLLWRSASDVRALKSFDTRQSAIQAIAAIYPYQSQVNREEAEKEWLYLDFSSFTNPVVARLQIVGTLFETIGESQLVTEAARNFLRNAKRDSNNLENGKLFEVKTYDLPWPEDEDTLARTEEAESLLALNSVLQTMIASLKEEATQEKSVRLWDAVVALDNAITEAGDSINVLVDKEVSDTLAEGLGIVLTQGHAPENVSQSALTRLLELTHHSDPQPADDTEESFAHSAAWGSPSPRITAAKALSTLVRIPAVWPKIRERFEAMLFDDPHPAVRLQLVFAIPRIGLVDDDAMWNLIVRFVAKEKNAAIIRFGAQALSALRGNEAERLEPHIIEMSKQVGPVKSGDDIITGLIMFFAINKDLSASRTIVHKWIESYASEEHRLQSALFDIREALVLGFDDFDERKEGIRRRAVKFIWSLISAVEPAVRSWPISGREPTAEEVIALKLFNKIADQIYYAVGYDKLTPSLATHAAKRKFLIEYTPLFSILSTLGTPASVHHLLQILSNLTDADPELCFDLFSEAILRTTGVARYEHESLGASLVVKLVGLYLADHRSIFVNETRREKLIDCLALFVEAGWPEARQLFQRLPELLQ